MSSEKISTLLSDVSIEGDIVEKDRIIIDAKINGDIKSEDVETHSSSNITGNITATGTSTIDNLTFNDNIIGSSSNADINLTPGGTGNVVLSSSLDFGSAVLSNGTATHAGSSGQQPLDEFAHATYRSAKYVVSITDATNTKYEIVELYITHDGSNAYISSQGVNSSTGGLAEFAADISGANLRVLIIPSTAESVTYKYLRTLIIV